MPVQTLPKWFARARSVESLPERRVRIGIPRVLNQWSTHRFWTALFRELGVPPRDIVFSAETSETQQREFGQGRGAVDCCYPVKCLAGHYGQLASWAEGDFDGDGRAEFSDFILLSQHFGLGSSEGNAAVAIPEPHCCRLLLIGLAGLWLGGRNRWKTAD